MAPSLTRRALVGASATIGLGARPAAADDLGRDAAAVHRRTTNPADLGILDAAALLRTGRLSSVELTEACLERITTRNGPVTFDGSADSINAWIRVYADLARQLARAADRRLADARRSGRPASPLCGVPVGLKDLYAVAGLPLTASSRVLDGSSPLFAENIAAGDSIVWERLRAAGMVLVGHTHTHEFAAGSATPQTGNPWDTARIPGGSSGGSAAALAARMVPAATGSDTGGSLRMPSSCCGTSTIKGTYGLVPTHGVIPLQWSYDHAGPMARSMDDVAVMLDVMAGPDARDTGSYSALTPRRYPVKPRRGARPLQGLRVGVVGNPGTVTAPVTEVYERFQRELASLGATLVAVELPTNPIEADATALVAGIFSEVAAYHAQFFPQRAALYRPQLAQVLTAASASPSLAVDLIRHQQLRGLFQELVNDLYSHERLDVLVMPTNSQVAQLRDEAGDLTFLTRTGAAGLTNVWDQAGFPALSTPAGLAEGMPVGMQVIGTAWSEAQVLQVGIDYQHHFPYWDEQPPSNRDAA